MVWLGLVVGCVLPDVSLEGRPCPCANGWVCDAPRSVCVREDGRDLRDGGSWGDRDAASGEDGGRASSDGGAHRDGSPEDVDGGSDPVDAGPDAGPVDAGPDAADPVDAGSGAPDGGADGGAPDAGPLPPDILFADDFEDGTTRAWAYRLEVNGALAVTEAAARAGRYGLRATVRDGDAVVGTPLGRTLTHGDLYVRLHLYAPAGERYDAPLSFVSLRTSSTDERVTFGIEGTRLTAHVAATGRFVAGTRAYLRNEWMCVVGHVRIGDATTGGIELTIDGARAVHATGIDTRSTPGWSVVEVGLGHAARAQPWTDLRIDDVTLATTPLRCD